MGPVSTPDFCPQPSRSLAPCAQQAHGNGSLIQIVEFNFQTISAR
jgi:hypothetical protein